MLDSFDESLFVGKIAESEIARWIRKNGSSTLPIYEVERGNYKGPVLYAPDGTAIIAPDILCFKNGKVYWVEAKHKEIFSFYRKKQAWQTGIDYHHWHEYLRIQLLIPSILVWLMFLHKGGIDKSSGKKSPAGLYARPISKLKDCIDHVDTSINTRKYAPHGMILWDIKSLKCLHGSYPLP